MANSLNAVAVSAYADGNGQVQKAYQTIGRAFETKTGWIVRLNALPTASLNDKGLVETVILLMPPKDDNKPQQSRGAGSGGNYLDSEIPFIMEWR